MSLRTILTTSLLAALPAVFAQQAPAAAPAPAAITIMPGPMANGGATAVAGASSAGMGLGGGAGNLSATTSATGATNTAGVIGQSGQIPVWVVKVGSPNNDLVFSPNTINGKPGEVVQFQFYSRNHSVVTSSFENPCVPNSQAAAGGAPPANTFFSGFMPTDKMGQLTYTIPIKDTSPMWFYCSQGRHCQDGMVGVINPPATGQTLADYQTRAAQAPNNVSPNGAGAGAGTGTGAGGGQIGGSQTTTAPTNAQTAKSVASVVRAGSWTLGLVAVAAWLLF